jgi:hypothetical protein
MEEPNRLIPKTDMDDPNRKNDRSDKVEPKVTKSRRLQQEPTLAMPYTAIELPKRAKVRNEQALPNET